MNLLRLFSIFLLVSAFGNSTSFATEITAEQWCHKIDRAVKELKWRFSPCKPAMWKIEGRSVKGEPLMVADFGDPNAENVTLVLTMVHADEITPLYIALKLIEWVDLNAQTLKDKRIVLAPLVNPDSFFHLPRKRVNANGVDINRNFETKDWEKDALRLWKTKFRSEPRRFPGLKAGSEPETRFQVELIKRVKPKKMLSVHAPLGFMDYDGPNFLTLNRFETEYVNKCLELRRKLNAVSGGYFPGSLGNFAGNEMGIPTLTLELPTANPAKADHYWKLFRAGIKTVIEFRVPDAT